MTVVHGRQRYFLVFLNFDFEQLLIIFLPLGPCLKPFVWIEKNIIYGIKYSKNIIYGNKYSKLAEIDATVADWRNKSSETIFFYLQH